MRARVWLPVSALVAASVWCVLLVVARRHAYGPGGFRYLVWNLGLAWLPLVFALLLYVAFRRRHTLAELLALGAAWLVFLPNAPYMLTDFIHLGDRHRLVDSLIFASFAFTALALGFASMLLVQIVVTRRAGAAAGWAVASGDDEEEDVQVRERVVEALPHRPGDEPWTRDDVPAVEAVHATEVHADAREEERRERDEPADPRARLARDDDLHQQKRREAERERGERERREDQRVGKPMPVAEVHEVGEHVRRVREEDEPRRTERDQLGSRVPKTECCVEEQREHEGQPREDEVPNEVAEAARPVGVMARGNEDDAPKRGGEEDGDREPDAGAHDDRVGENC